MLKQASWPRVIKFHGKRFQVRLVSEEALRKHHPERTPEADFDRETSTIRIWRDLENKARWTALLHEILHLAALIARGLEPGAKVFDLEESLIGKIDTILYEILSTNFGYGYKEVRRVLKNRVKQVTLSGYDFDVTNPDESMISIEEIAHCLAYQCRYNGHIPAGKFLSVAEHSVIVCERVQRDDVGVSSNLPLVALLHDAAEAYTGDIIKPIKNIFPEIREIEKGVQDAIYKKFGLEVSANVAQAVKTADLRVGELERMYFGLLRDGDNTSNETEYLEPIKAEKMFLNKFKEVYHAKE